MEEDLEDCERRVRAWERKMNYYRERTSRLEEALRTVPFEEIRDAPGDQDAARIVQDWMMQRFAALESESRV